MSLKKITLSQRGEVDKRLAVFVSNQFIYHRRLLFYTRNNGLAHILDVNDLHLPFRKEDEYFVNLLLPTSKITSSRSSTAATGLSSICLSSRTCLAMLNLQSISDEIIDVFHFKYDQIYDEKFSAGHRIHHPSSSNPYLPQSTNFRD